MPEEVQDAQVAAPSPAETQSAPSAEPSPEGQPVSEQTPPPTSQPVAPQFNMPPAERWEELRQQKVAAEQRAQHAETMARMALERVQAQSPTPVDPYAGMDPTLAEQYRALDKRIEERAAIIADQKIAQIAGPVRQELAGMKIAYFREKNPEIKPNSPEEHAIAEFVGQGYDLDAAKKLALYDRQEQELLALRAKQSSVGQKVAANQTGPTSGMPATAGLPGRPGDWRENVRQAARKGGSLADIVNAAGASRAP